MTNPSGLGRSIRSTFHSPISEGRAARIVADLSAGKPATVVDYGSGWGELLLRVVAATPDARGTGIDIFGPDIERGRANAAERGLTDRVTFIEGSATDHAAPADLVLNSGAYQAFGSLEEALTALRPLVNPGGRLLFGAEYWEQTPSAERLAKMWPDMALDSCVYLPDLVGLAVAAGFRPLWIETVTRGEWEEMESGYARGPEEWLLANGDHPEAAKVREDLDKTRAIWLTGHRDYFGFALLTLGVPD